MSVGIDAEGKAKIKLTKQSQTVLAKAGRILSAMAHYDAAAKEAADKVDTVSKKYAELSL